VVPVSEEPTGTGAPTQAYQRVSKKGSEEEEKRISDLLVSVAARLSVKHKCCSALSGFAAPSAPLAPSSPLAGSSTTHGAMAYGGSPPPEAIAI
jgi:hypothetical protein